MVKLRTPRSLINENLQALDLGGSARAAPMADIPAPDSNHRRTPGLGSKSDNVGLRDGWHRRPAGASMRQGVEQAPGGEAVGRDPRKMTADELRSLGHAPCTPIKALRARCLDCCGGSAHEVRACVAVTCAAWPFRLGKSPWRKPASDAQRAASHRNAANLRRPAARPRDFNGASSQSGPEPIEPSPKVQISATPVKLSAT